MSHNISFSKKSKKTVNKTICAIVFFIEAGKESFIENNCRKKILINVLFNEKIRFYCFTCVLLQSEDGIVRL